MNKETKTLGSKAAKMKALKEKAFKEKMVSIVQDPTVSPTKLLNIIENEIKRQDDEVSFNYYIECFFEDGTYALSLAVEEVIGFTSQKMDKNMSGQGDPPQMLDILFSDGTRLKVPIGRIQVPLFGPNSYIDINYHSKERLMKIEGVCQNKYRDDMDQIMDITKEILKKQSIYSGKAIKLSETPNESPAFIDVSNYDKIKVFLNPSATVAAMEIEERIKNPEELVKNNIPVKMGVLLPGPFGTGKTAYANSLAKLAVDNGWTYIYCSNPKETLEALKVSIMLSSSARGVVLFIEDIDRELKERNDVTNEISLLLDGSESKNANIITVFTTNNIMDIDPTFIRGKRIGSIINFEHLCAEVAEEMLLHLLVDRDGKSLVKDNKLPLSSKIIEDNKIVPAFVAEIAEKANLRRMIFNKEEITDNDVLNIIQEYNAQVELSRVRENKDELRDAMNTLKAYLGYKEELYEKLDHIAANI